MLLSWIFSSDWPALGFFSCGEFLLLLFLKQVLIIFEIEKLRLIHVDFIDWIVFDQTKLSILIENRYDSGVNNPTW